MSEDSNSKPKPKSRKAPPKFSGLIASGVIKPQVETDVESEIGSTMPSGERVPLAPAEAAAKTQDLISIVPVTLVDDSPYQSREQYRAEEIDELASAMEWDAMGPGVGEGKGAGQQEPIIVRKVGDRYELIAGHRRIRAFRTRGWPYIKAAIVERSDHEAELATMVHNEGRQNLCDYEKAKLYKRALAGKFAKTQAEVAVIFATKQDEVSRRLGMFKLPPAVLQLLDEQNNLFSAYTADAIRDLLKEFPTNEGLIVQAIERLKDGAKESSIRGWVTQALSKHKADDSKNSKRKVVTDQKGKHVFTASLTGRVISLRINAADVSAEATLNRVYEYLQNSTNTAE